MKSEWIELIDSDGLGCFIRLDSIITVSDHLIVLNGNHGGKHGAVYLSEDQIVKVKKALKLMGEDE